MSELAKEIKGAGGFKEFTGYSSNTKMVWYDAIANPTTTWGRFWTTGNTPYRKAVAYAHIVFNGSTADYVLGKMEEEVSAALSGFTLSLKLTKADGQLKIYYKASEDVGGFGNATMQAAIIGMD